MKQVVFAVFLLAMASLTGCLNEEDDESQSSYNPNKNSSIRIPDNMTVVKTGNTITTDCYTTQYYGGWWQDNKEAITIMDADSNIIWNLNPSNWAVSWDWSSGEIIWDSIEFEHGWEACDITGNTGNDIHNNTTTGQIEGQMRININLPQEPVRFGITYSSGQTYIGTF